MRPWPIFSVIFLGSDNIWRNPHCTRMVAPVPCWQETQPAALFAEVWVFSAGVLRR
jgi:hypothetical protein